MATDAPHSESEAAAHKTPIARQARWLAVAVVAVRLIVGCVFVVSGGAKLIDPAGTMYKIDDYLAVMHLTAFSSLSMLISVSLSLIEFVLGVSVLLGSYRKAVPVLLVLFMGIMTPLTLYLAIANPIHDCGCFGDAIVLTNWQTFAKNVVLLLLVLFLLKYNLQVRSLFHREIQSLTVLYAAFYGAVVAWIGCTYQPLIDFRPYKVGIDVRAALYGEDVQEVEFDFIYEKDGSMQTFTLDSLPDEAEGWNFVRRIERSSAQQQAETPTEIDHFVVYDGGDDVTEELLEQDGYMFMLFSPDIERANDDEVNKINELYDYCLEYGYPFYAVTASSPAAADHWLDDTGGEYRFLFMDKTTIRTIARNNPYVLIMKDGVIYRKCTVSMLPEEAELTVPFEEIGTFSQPESYDETMRIGMMVLALAVPLGLLLLTEHFALFVVRRIHRFCRSRRKKEAS